MGVTILFDSQTTNGSSAEHIAKRNKAKLVKVGGTFDGATITLEGKDNKGNFIPINGGAFTSAECRLLEAFPEKLTLRATVSGAGGSTSINAEIG